MICSNWSLWLANLLHLWAASSKMPPLKFWNEKIKRQPVKINRVFSVFTFPSTCFKTSSRDLCSRINFIAVTGPTPLKRWVSLINCLKHSVIPYKEFYSKMALLSLHGVVYSFKQCSLILLKQKVVLKHGNQSPTWIAMRLWSKKKNDNKPLIDSQ